MPILGRKRATRQAHPSSVRFADSFPQGGSLFCCRAASPLAAVAVCGGGKCPGGMNPSPTMRTSKRDLAQACGPGMPGPYRAVSFHCPRSRAGVSGTTAVRGCFLLVRPLRGRTNKKIPHRPEQRTMRAKRNKQTAKKAQSKTPKRRRSLLLAGTAPARQTAG